MKDPELIAKEIFNEYYNWVKIINYNIESKDMLEAIAKDMALICVDITLNSHNTKDEIIYWSKVKKLLNSKLPNSKS